MAKVLISGRGGSGKSTLVSLLAAEAGRTAEVLVIDTDESNLGLASMMGMAAPAQSVMDGLGGRPVVGTRLMESLKSGKGEAVRLFEERFTIEALPAESVSRKGNVSLVRIGKIEHAHEGCACPMGAVARAFLKHLALEEDQWALIDTEAGVEHFGRGVIEGVDAVVLVVDPSHEAVILSEKAAGLCGEAGKPFVVILNKVDGGTERTLREMLAAKGLRPAGAIPYSAAVVQANLAGERLDEPSLTVGLIATIDSLTGGSR